VFSVFSSSGTNIYSREPNELQGVPVSLLANSAGAGAVLPPNAPTSVQGYLADNTTFLPAETTFPTRSYTSRLGLDYIGAPTIGYGSSSFGSGFFGAVSAYFGDMLGNKTLGVAMSGESDFSTFGAQAFYVNSSRRLNWGVLAGRTPYLSASTTVTAVNSNTFQIDQTVQRAYYDQAQVMFQYPLSRARRLEFDAGFTHVSYDTRLFRWFESGGIVQGPNELATTSSPSISFARTSAAMVGDNSFFGATAPVAGGRYRIEGSPTFGGINFQTVLADGRRYLYARPFTLAFRALHVGRYGRDAEDSRITPLYLGSDQLVRGYDLYSFTGADCGTSASQTSGCPEFDRLIGSRLAVANAELRIPMFGGRGHALIPSSFLPIDMALFADAGVAWSAGESPSLRFDRSTADRVPVVSAGISTRINLLGFAVAEVFYARPFQRSARSGIWGLQFAPGW
jgi:hypothetical protein